MEDLSGSAHTTQQAPAMCILIYVWDDPGGLPSGGYIHLPVEHHKGQAIGLCTASWQLEFGCSLLCWNGGREEEEGMRGWMGHGCMVHTGWRLLALCPLPFPRSCLPFLGPRGWGTMLGDCGGPGQQDGPHAPVCTTGCPVPEAWGGPVLALMAAMLEASHP